MQHLPPRRLLLTLLIVPLLAIAIGGNARAQTPPRERLTLLLDWFVNPNHAPIVIAERRGLFARHGLDVQIVEPADPSAPPRLVAAGRGDIAISYQPTHIRGIAEGLPIVRVGALVATPLNTLTVLADGPVKTLGDLRGRTIGYSGAGIHDIMLKTMLGSVGMTEADVRLVNVNFALTAGLISGRVDAIIGGFRNFEATEIAIAGKTPKMFFPEEHGVPAYDELIYVTRNDRQGDARIRRFLAAVEEATIMILNEPERAWRDFIAAHPKLDDRLNRQAWIDTLPRFQASPAAVDPERYVRMAEFMRAGGIIPKAEPVERYIGPR